MATIDLTDVSPRELRLRVRDPSEVTGICVHQTAFQWAESNPRIALIKAHYCVLPSGTVAALHPPMTRMSHGSGPVGNRTMVNIEVMNNLQTSPGKWWKGERYGRHTLADYPSQVTAVRELVKHLRDAYEGIRTITGHRALQKGKSGCPGSELYREVVWWSVLNLGMTEGPTMPDGSTIPDTWRGVPTL